MCRVPEKLNFHSLDVLKAYHTTWKSSIINNLILVFSHMFKCICNFLKTRSFQVRVGQTLSKLFSQFNGVSQGSISVTLFLVTINNITKNIAFATLPSKQRCILTTSIYFHSSKNITIIEAQLQLTIDKLTNWSQ